MGGEESREGGDSPGEEALEYVRICSFIPLLPSLPTVQRLYSKLPHWWILIRFLLHKKRSPVHLRGSRIFPSPRAAHHTREILQHEQQKSISKYMPEPCCNRSFMMAKFPLFVATAPRVLLLLGLRSLSTHGPGERVGQRCGGGRLYVGTARLYVA